MDDLRLSERRQREKEVVMDDETLTLEGYLLKKGEKGPKKDRYKKRWFVLETDNNLHYYVRPDLKKEKGLILLRDASIGLPRRRKMTMVRRKSKSKPKDVPKKNKRLGRGASARGKRNKAKQSKNPLAHQPEELDRLPSRFKRSVSGGYFDLWEQQQQLAQKEEEEVEEEFYERKYVKKGAKKEIEGEEEEYEEFQIITPHRIYYLCAMNHEELHFWLKGLIQVKQQFAEEMNNWNETERNHKEYVEKGGNEMVAKYEERELLRHEESHQLKGMILSLEQEVKRKDAALEEQKRENHELKIQLEDSLKLIKELMGKVERKEKEGQVIQRELIHQLKGKNEELSKTREELRKKKMNRESGDEVFDPKVDSASSSSESSTPSLPPTLEKEEIPSEVKKGRGRRGHVSMRQEDLQAQHTLLAFSSSGQ